MLKVWDSLDHRATMDIDLLARTSNQIDNLHRIITEVSEIACDEDGIAFDTQKLILRNTQTGGDYNGVSSSFSAKLFTTKMPVLIDIGFNDIIIPNPQQIQYPTLLDMPEPTLFGYTLETVIARIGGEACTGQYSYERLLRFVDHLKEPRDTTRKAKHCHSRSILKP